MAETGGRIDPLRGLLGVVLGLALVALVGLFLVIVAIAAVVTMAGAG